MHSTNCTFRNHHVSFPTVSRTPNMFVLASDSVKLSQSWPTAMTSSEMSPIRQWKRNSMSTSLSSTIKEDNTMESNKLPCTNLPVSTSTSVLAALVSNATKDHLSSVVQNRSRRMMLDTLGVGVLGFNSDTMRTMNQWADNLGYIRSSFPSSPSTNSSVIWGSSGLKTSPGVAAFLNGISVHSMDFDDTWHPATHPSGPVLPAVLSLAEYMTGSYRPSLEDVLVAYNVGIQTQGLLLQCSNKSREIPERFHPPAVVGVMGSAAASSRLLGLNTRQTSHALAIAASFAGAPMANAGTKTKPLHAGKSARCGLEAALMAERGMEGNEDIIGMASGFGAFFEDYRPEVIFEKSGTDPNDYILHNQDVAIKRFPAHLGMHWAIETAMDVLEMIKYAYNHPLHFSRVQNVEIIAPRSKYINRPFPASEHEARHSFQFITASTLLDGSVTPQTFHLASRSRQSLQQLLRCIHLKTHPDNHPSFNDMYINLIVTLDDGQTFESRCNTPYGHWRRPLSDADLQQKFIANTASLPVNVTKEILKTVNKTSGSSEELVRLLRS